MSISHVVFVQEQHTGSSLKPHHVALCTLLRAEVSIDIIFQSKKEAFTPLQSHALPLQPDDPRDMELIQGMLELVDDTRDLLCPTLGSFLSRVEARSLLYQFTMPLTSARLCPNNMLTHSCIHQYEVNYTDHLYQWAKAVILDQLGGMRSPDDLITFFGELAELIQPAGSMPTDGSAPETFDPHSMFGKFLRRCTLAFEELTFEASTYLLQHACMLRQMLLGLQFHMHLSSWSSVACLLTLAVSSVK